MKTKSNLSPEEREELRVEADRLNAEARENWGDPQWHRLMAQEVAMTITEGFEHESLLDLMTTVESVPLDGDIWVKETRGLQAFWVARGGYIQASTLRQDAMRLERDSIGFHVYEFEEKLLTNFAETQQTLIDLGIERLNAEVNLRLLRLFQAAVPNSSPYYIGGSGVSLAALDTAINEVFDESKEGQISIIGRRTMIGQVVDAIVGSSYGGFIPETNEEVRRTGVLGQYKGANLVYLINYKDDEDVSFFPANEMYVVGTDASKVGLWGDLMSRDWTDNNWYWHYVAKRDMGGTVHRPERLRRIVDTSLAP